MNIYCIILYIYLKFTIFKLYILHNKIYFLFSIINIIFYQLSKYISSSPLFNAPIINITSASYQDDNKDPKNFLTVKVSIPNLKTNFLGSVKDSCKNIDFKTSDELVSLAIALFLLKLL